MFERLFGGRVMDPDTAERIPPGQSKTDKFPVLHYGSVPRTDLATWDFKVYGEVDNPFTLTWEQFKALPRKTVHTDIHCVTRWTKLDTDWEGVPIQEILKLAQVRPTATHVVSHAEQGYTANVPLSVLDDDDVLLADTFDGQPLELEHGWPVRRSPREDRAARGRRTTLHIREGSGLVPAVPHCIHRLGSGPRPPMMPINNREQVP